MEEILLPQVPSEPGGGALLQRKGSEQGVCLQDQLLVPPWWLSGGDCRETTARRFVFALGRDRGRIGNVIKYGN